MQRVLGVAIGIAVVCLLLSIIASHLQEVWSTLSARRAASLEEAIINMFGNEDLAKKFFDHPLIQTISFSVPRSWWRRKAPQEPRPTYISSVLFSRVLFATLAEYHNVTGGVTLPELIRRLPPSDLQKRLQAVVVGAGDNAQACALAIELWYDGTMDRINGFYKRNTQWTLLTLGVILAVICNANLFTITEKLWTSDDARAALNARAQMYACKEGANCPYPSYTVAETEMSNQLETYLPVGYHGKGLRAYWGSVWNGVRARRQQWKGSDPRWHSWPAPLGDWLYHLAGWGLTGIAVSLGAPFWFDAVNKLINIRLAGEKPPRAMAPLAIVTPPLPPPDSTVVNVIAPQANAPPVDITPPQPPPDPGDGGDSGGGNPGGGSPGGGNPGAGTTVQAQPDFQAQPDPSASNAGVPSPDESIPAEPVQPAPALADSPAADAASSSAAASTQPRSAMLSRLDHLIRGASAGRPGIHSRTRH
jgi:hypothetical protein